MEMEDGDLIQIDVDSDNDSVDSFQLLADITDAMNSSSDVYNVKVFDKKDLKVIDQPASTHCDDESLKSTLSQDEDKLEKQINPSIEKDLKNEGLQCDLNNKPEGEVVASATSSTITNPTEQPTSTLISEKKCVPTRNVMHDLNLKEPVICLTRLDPNIQVLKVESTIPTPTAHSSGQKETRKKGEVKKSVWHDEGSSLSDVFLSDILNNTNTTVKVPKTGTVKLKPREKLNTTKSQERDKNFEIVNKNLIPGSDYHKCTADVETSSKKLKAKMELSDTAHSLIATFEAVNSNHNSSSQPKKLTSSPAGSRIHSSANKVKDIEMSSRRNSEKYKEVVEKSKDSTVPDSRKRSLSRGERGTVSSSHSCDGNPPKMFKEIRTTADVKNECDWFFELQLQPFGIEDLNDEAFRKFVNLASDCAVSLESAKSGKRQGHVHLYFGCLSNMQSGMHKLSQLSLTSPKALQGIIKCCRVKPASEKESNSKWKTTEEDWKRDEKTKRKCAQIPRLPSFMSKEMISLLFPFSLNVHSHKPNSGDHKKDLQGHTEIEFESTAWMETVLSCFRDFYITKVGSGNPVWQLTVSNFKPPTEKIPERPVLPSPSSSNHPKESRESKPPADLAPKDKFKGRPGSKQSDSYHQRQAKGPAGDSGKDGGGNVARKRPFPPPDNPNTKGGTAEKKSKILASVDQDVTDKENLKELAQSKGLDPNNADVMRILEVQNQLLSLQALFSSNTSEDKTNLSINESCSTDSAQGRARPNVKLNDQGQTGKGNMTIMAAEQQLRENIAMKQKQLKELEEKLQQKKGLSNVDQHISSVSPNLTGDSLRRVETPESYVVPGQNNEPLDFTKPAVKIEEAVKKDEERSKMLAARSCTPQRLQGKNVFSTEAANKADDFALPLQFGKNVKKAVTDIATTANKGNPRGFESLKATKPPMRSILTSGNRARDNKANRRFDAHNKPVNTGKSQVVSDGKDSLDRDRFFVFDLPKEVPSHGTFCDSGNSNYNRSRTNQNLSKDYGRDKPSRENVNTYGRFHDSKIDNEMGHTHIRSRGNNSLYGNKFETDDLNTLNEVNYDMDEKQFKNWKSGNEGNSFRPQQRILNENVPASFKGKHKEDFQLRQEDTRSKFSLEPDYGLPRDNSFSDGSRPSRGGHKNGPQANTREVLRREHEQSQHAGSSNVPWEEDRMFDRHEHQHRDLEVRQSSYIDEDFEELNERVQFQGSGLRGRGNTLRGNASQINNRATQMRGRGVNPQNQREGMFSKGGWNRQKAGEKKYMGLDTESKDEVTPRGMEYHPSTEMRGIGFSSQMDSKTRGRGVGRALKGKEPSRNAAIRGRNAGVAMRGRGREPQGSLQDNQGAIPTNDRAMQMRARGPNPPSQKDERFSEEDWNRQKAEENRYMGLNSEDEATPRDMEYHQSAGIRGVEFTSKPRGRGVGRGLRGMEPSRDTAMRGRNVGRSMMGRGRDPQRSLQDDSGNRYPETRSEGDVMETTNANRNGGLARGRGSFAMRGRGDQQQRVAEKSGLYLEPEDVTDRSEREAESLQYTSMSIRGRGIEAQRGVGFRGRGMMIQIGSGTRGRGREIAPQRDVEPQRRTGGLGRGLLETPKISAIDVRVEMERPFTHSYEEESSAGVGFDGRGTGEFHRYKEETVQRGRGRGMNYQRGRGSVSREGSYGDRYSSTADDVRDLRESTEHSQNQAFGTDEGRQGNFSNLSSQRGRGMGRDTGVPQRGGAADRHFRAPQRDNGPDRQFEVPQRDNGPDRHFEVPQRDNGPDRHFEVPQRDDGPDRHFEVIQRDKRPNRHFAAHQRGVGANRHFGASQRNDGPDRHFEVPQRDNGPGRHFGAHQREDGVNRHFGASQRNDGPDRHFEVPQRDNGPGRHFGAHQRENGANRHFVAPERDDGLDRHFGVPQGKSEADKYFGPPQREGNHRGRGNPTIGHVLTDTRGRGIDSQFQDNSRGMTRGNMF